LACQISQILIRARDSGPEHPKWSKEHVLQSLTEQVIDDHKYLTTIIEYWFANNFHSLTERPPSSYQARERSSAITKVKQNVETQIQLKAGVILLEMTMPNGKLLRDCTGAECSKLSSKIGGWLLRISKRVRPTQTVGSVLNEDQVRQLYAKS
jgi:hypothetical protein